MYMWKSGLQGQNESRFGAFLPNACAGFYAPQSDARWLPGDWSAKGANVTALQLQRLLDKALISQRGAAKALEINERTMRRYVSGEQPIPKVVEYACYYLWSQDL